MRLLPLLLGVALWAHPRPARADARATAVLEAAWAAQRASSSIQQVEMALVSKGGAARTRSFEMRVRRDEAAVMVHIRFLSPADVAGIQVVQIDRVAGADEQLLYLPALRRVTRIAGAARKGAFLGSDFSHEDLQLAGQRGGTHSLVEEGADRVTIDTDPGADSSYGRIRTTVSKADQLPRTVEFFDRAGAAVKRLEVLEVQTVDGHPLPTRTVMRDLQKGSSTTLRVVSARMDVPLSELPEADFTAAGMEARSPVRGPARRRRGRCGRRAAGPRTPRGAHSAGAG
jgi:hypothetical protein